MPRERQALRQQEPELQPLESQLQEPPSEPQLQPGQPQEMRQLPASQLPERSGVQGEPEPQQQRPAALLELEALRQQQEAVRSPGQPGACSQSPELDEQCSPAGGAAVRCGAEREESSEPQPKHGPEQRRRPEQPQPLQA